MKKNKFNFDKNILGDIVKIKTANSKGLYTSFVDYENKIVVTKILYEIIGFDKEIVDIIKDLNLELYYDEDVK